MKFIVKYAGAPIRFTRGFAETVSEDQATVFTNYSAAWRRISEQNLNPDHCRVEKLLAVEPITQN